MNSLILVAARRSSSTSFENDIFTNHPRKGTRNTCLSVRVSYCRVTVFLLCLLSACFLFNPSAFTKAKCDYLGVQLPESLCNLPKMPVEISLKPRSFEPEKTDFLTPRIYIYDLPCKFNTCMDNKMSAKINREGIVQEMQWPGLYHVNQFALDHLFHEHMLASPYRVDDPDEANMFYVPFFAGVNSFGQNQTELYTETFNILRQKAHFQRNGGVDHFMTAGVCTEYIAQQRDLLAIMGAKNVIKLTIESGWNKTAYDWLTGENNFYPVPYPSMVQLDERVVEGAFKDGNRTADGRLPFEPHSDRPIFVTIAAGNFTKLRQRLNAQCDSHRDLCSFGGEGVEQREGGVGLKRGPKMNTALAQAYNQSVFCLQPSGDTPTRKGLFDSLLLGCILVVFNPYSLHLQYRWHMDGVNPQDITVYIPEDDVMSEGLDVIDYLSKIPQDEISRIQKNIGKIAARFQYSRVDMPEEIGIDSTETIVQNLLRIVEDNLS
eukprot:comp12257_c0_seq1/m.7066 comp12257_c0_seq1/g.7066  ORF comp12257_c0_seq1/g.7066 comp12257_c0_seq1/m.7066 type:complete len:490 (-) comp12257_c0_seq1:89-1558(-)